MDRAPVILLIDDYDLNLELLQILVKQMAPSAVIRTAMTGREAMRAFAEQDPDLVLMDVMLPDASGFDLCRTMKQRRGQDFLPIILITALNDHESLLTGLSAGADDFLTKPVNGDELSIRVKNLLQLRRVTADLNARYHQLDAEMKIARELLIDFMPRRLPAIEDVYVDVLYEPSSYIGGDFYDIFQIDAHQYGFFMADVKGHGASAAMIVAMLREQLYRLKELRSQPDHMFQALNDNLCRFFEDVRNDYFVTALYLIYNSKTRTVRWVNAGHNPPGYFHTGNATVLDAAGGLPLGIFAETVYAVAEHPVDKHGAMLLYTDGIFELPLFYMPMRSFFSIQEVITFLQDNHIVPTASLISYEIRKLISTVELSDDVNVIAIEF